MGLNANELIELIPEVEHLVKTLNEALKKDDDGKVRVTKEEAKQIRAAAAKIALQLAKDVVD